MAVLIRPFRAEDASAVATLVQRCLRDVNSRDYPLSVIDKMCAHFTAARFLELAKSRSIYVADDNRVVGTVSRDGNKVFTMFVDPNSAGQGIGRELMGHIEALAAGEGTTTWRPAPASQVTAST